MRHSNLFFLPPCDFIGPLVGLWPTKSMKKKKKGPNRCLSMRWHWSLFTWWLKAVKNESSSPASVISPRVARGATLFFADWSRTFCDIKLARKENCKSPRRCCSFIRIQFSRTQVFISISCSSSVISCHLHMKTRRTGRSGSVMCLHVCLITPKQQGRLFFHLSLRLMMIFFASCHRPNTNTSPHI